MAIPGRPTYSWSHSRARMLSECARRYFLQYYLAWGGWKSSAPAESRLAYRLKNLTPLAAAVGIVIHRLAAAIASEVRAGREVPEVDIVWGEAARALNEIWRSSDHRDEFVRDPKRHPMLSERYYNVPMSQEKLSLLRLRVRHIVENLCDWPGWYDVAAAAEVHFFEATDPVMFKMDDVSFPLYAAPDLVFKDTEGVWHILDWKTSARMTEQGVEQVRLYYLYLILREVISETDLVEGVVVHLGIPDEERFTIGPADIPRYSDSRHG
jgi:hypothetical protein